MPIDPPLRTPPRPPPSHSPAQFAAVRTVVVDEVAYEAAVYLEREAGGGWRAAAHPVRAISESAAAQFAARGVVVAELRAPVEARRVLPGVSRADWPAVADPSTLRAIGRAVAAAVGGGVPAHAPHAPHAPRAARGDGRSDHVGAPRTGRRGGGAVDGPRRPKQRSGA